METDLSFDLSFLDDNSKEIKKFLTAFRDDYEKLTDDEKTGAKKWLGAIAELARNPPARSFDPRVILDMTMPEGEHDYFHCRVPADLLIRAIKTIEQKGKFVMEFRRLHALGLNGLRGHPATADRPRTSAIRSRKPSNRYGQCRFTMCRLGWPASSRRSTACQISYPFRHPTQATSTFFPSPGVLRLRDGRRPSTFFFLYAPFTGLWCGRAEKGGQAPHDRSLFSGFSLVRSEPVPPFPAA